MTYRIKKEQRRNAKDLGVDIEPSKAKGKKIQVNLPDGKRVQIGAKGYKDYATYKETNLKQAQERRDLYRARHRCDNANRFSANHLSCEILWGKEKSILRGK